MLIYWAMFFKQGPSHRNVYKMKMFLSFIRNRYFVNQYHNDELKKRLQKMLPHPWKR